MHDWSQIKYFKKSEWGKDPEKVDWALILGLDILRERAGVPITIHCAWDDSGHAANSQHYLGRAVDFHISPRYTPIQEYQIIKSLNIFTGIGWYPSWSPVPGWHLDTRNGHPVEWYQKNGQYIYGQDSLIERLKGAN